MIELRLQCIIIIFLHEPAVGNQSFLRSGKRCKKRLKDNKKKRDRHNVGGEQNKETWEGELYRGPRGGRGQRV